jgi:hypothetical protein
MPAERHTLSVYSALESLQYGFLYLVAAFVGGTALDFTFPRFTKDRPTGQLALEVLLQCLLLVVVVIVIRFIVQKVPFVLHHRARATGYAPYGTSEFGGEMMMGLVFLSSQLNLIAKIDDLATRMYEWLFNQKRVVERDL